MIAPVTSSASPTHQAWEFEKQLQCGIVAGVDGSRESIAALNTAAAIARLRRCSLHAVSVLPHLARTGREQSPGSLEEIRLAMRSSELADLVRSLEPARDWSSEVVVGRAGRELAAIADRRGAELVVLGRRRHGSMDRVDGAWSKVESYAARPPRQKGQIVADEGDGGEKLAAFLAERKFV